MPWGKSVCQFFFERYSQNNHGGSKGPYRVEAQEAPHPNLRRTFNSIVLAGSGRKDDLRRLRRKKQLELNAKKRRLVELEKEQLELELAALESQVGQSQSTSIQYQDEQNFKESQEVNDHDPVDDLRIPSSDEEPDKAPDASDVKKLQHRQCIMTSLTLCRPKTRAFESFSRTTRTWIFGQKTTKHQRRNGSQNAQTKGRLQADFSNIKTSAAGRASTSRASSVSIRRGSNHAEARTPVTTRKRPAQSIYSSPLRFRREKKLKRALAKKKISNRKPTTITTPPCSKKTTAHPLNNET